MALDSAIAPPAGNNKHCSLNVVIYVFCKDEILHFYVY